MRLKIDGTWYTSERNKICIVLDPDVARSLLAAIMTGQVLYVTGSGETIGKEQLMAWAQGIAIDLDTNKAPAASSHIADFGTFDAGEAQGHG